MQADIDRLKAAVKGLDVEPYLPAISPGRIENWLFNEYYPTDEAFLVPLIADAREALGAGRYATAREAGRGLSSEQAFADAQEWLKRAS